MTVYIEKPALNLRSELASLRNQGGYQEQQFYFDGLVTNGTFDSNTAGWTANRSTLSVVSGALRVTENGTDTALYGYQTIATEIGKTYRVEYDLVTLTAVNHNLWVGTTFSNASAYFGANKTTTGPQVHTFVANAADLILSFRGSSTTGGTTEHFDVDNVSVFETDGTDVIHTMPQGWKPKDFYEDGLLQREGAANDYEVIYDGFDYVVKPTVAPSATTQTCVIGVKA